jgi:hypothetical protein
VGFWLVGFSCVFSMSLKVVKKLKLTVAATHQGVRNLCVAKLRQTTRCLMRIETADGAGKTHFKRLSPELFALRTCGRNARLQPLLRRNQIEIECVLQVAYAPIKHRKRHVNPNLT